MIEQWNVNKHIGIGTLLNGHKGGYPEIFYASLFGVALSGGILPKLNFLIEIRVSKDIFDFEKSSNVKILN